MGVNKQKRVRVSLEPVDKQIYARINKQVMYDAIKELSACGQALSLWLYFSGHQDKYEFDLSSKYVKEQLGLGKTAYDNAIHTLIEKGYLVKTERNKDENFYVFHQKPLSGKDDKGQQGNNNKAYRL